MELTSGARSAIRAVASPSVQVKGGKIHSLELAKLRKVEMEKHEEARKAHRESFKAEIEKRKKEREEIKMKEEAKRRKEEKQMLKEMVDLSKNLKTLRKELKSNKLAVKCARSTVRAGSRVEGPSIQVKLQAKKEGKIDSLEIAKLRKVEMEMDEEARRAKKDSVKAEIEKRKKEREEQKKKEEEKKVQEEKKMLKEMKNLGKRMRSNKSSLKKTSKPSQIAAINTPLLEAPSSDLVGTERPYQSRRTLFTTLPCDLIGTDMPLSKDSGKLTTIMSGLDWKKGGLNLSTDGKSDSDQKFELPIGVLRKIGSGFGFGLSDCCTDASSSASSLGFETESDSSGCDRD